MSEKLWWCWGRAEKSKFMHETIRNAAENEKHLVRVWSWISDSLRDCEKPQKLQVSFPFRNCSLK